MREIKYQAWDRQNNRMFNVARFDFADYSMYNHLFGKPIAAEECDIREYTGLKDTNGVDVYEGDIIRYNVKHFVMGRYVESISTEPVEYNEGTFWLDAELLGEAKANDEELEVIGNIYENTEILEGADK